MPHAATSPRPAAPRPRRAPAAAALVLLAALVAAGPAAARVPFRVVETDGLRLVYPHPALSYLAPHVARCFENSMAFHRRLFGYTSREQVNVILTDSGDYGNAGVWVNPRNSLLLHVAPANFVYETAPSNERVNFTMNHEGVHIVALDQASGGDRRIRSLLGGKVRETAEHPETLLYSFLTVPRRAAPRWYHEGIAVFLETWMAGGLGRAQGPWDEMVFRSMVRDGSPFWDPLGLESEGTKVDFQVGVNSYLYGTRFVTWLAWHEGPERVVEWVTRGPGSRRYFASQFRAVFGRPLAEAWREWIAWERSFQRANLDSLRRHPTTPYRDLSPQALGSVSRAFVDRAGGALLAGVFHPGAVAHLAAIPLAGGAPRPLREVKGPALYFVCSVAFDPDRRRLFYTTDNNDWRDLWELDLATGAARRLMRDARIGDLAFHPVDRSLWGVRHYNGISTLVRIPPPYAEWTRIASLPYGQGLYDLDISPDGRLLAASHAEISGRQTLRLMGLEALARGDTASRELHDFGTSIPTSFVFSPDGRHLYGSSYYTGVSNVFRYDLAADSMDIVTNAETGFFRPVPIGGDSLIVFRYSGEGFVPAVLEARPLADVSAVTFLGERLAARRPVVRSWKVPSPARVPLDSLVRRRGDYRPLAAVRLASLYPIVEGYKSHAALGLAATLSDPVGIHVLDLSASRSAARDLDPGERWHVAARYRRLGFTAAARWNGASFYDLVGPTRTSRKGTALQLGQTWALLRDPPRQLELAAGLSGHGGLERLPDHQNVATGRGFDRAAGADLRLSYRHLRSSIGAADVEKGHAWKLIGSIDAVRSAAAGGPRWRSFPKVRGSLDLGTPLPLRNASLWVRGAAGYSPGDRDEPFARFYFGGFGNNWIDHGEIKRYREIASFPGLEIDALGGTRFGKLGLEWNLPALRFRRAGGLALYAAWARLSLFGGAIVTDPGDPARDRAAHAGGQVDVRFALFTQQPLTLSAGYARAGRDHARPRGEWMVSLKIL